MHLGILQQSHKFFLAVLVGLMAGCQASPGVDLVCFEQQCYQVEVVSKEEDRARGLQHRTQLPADHGMLFIFPVSRIQPFWMKDTLIPLDIIWIDHGQRVVHIEANVPPCQQDPCPSYIPVGKSIYVLELNAGEAARMGLQKGDRLEFRITMD